MLKRLL